MSKTYRPYEPKQMFLLPPSTSVPSEPSTSLSAGLQQAEQTDAAEDAQYGKDKRGDELPAELERAETRLARIRELRQELEAEARSQTKDRDDDDGSTDGPAEPTLPSHRIPTEKGCATPTPKAQRNFTDPESRS